MFPVEKLSQFESTNPSYRILKPWWDVFTDYLSAVILIIALSAGAMQVLQGDLICLPAAECSFNLSKVSNDPRNGSIPVSTSFLKTNRSFCQKYYASATRNSRMTVVALTKLEDRRQYDFVDAQCGQEAVHWFASYLPFILLLQAVILVIVDNFWLKFPKTSSIMDHFVKLVLECFNSPGTCLDVSNVLWGTQISEDADSNATEDIEQGTGERDALLRNKTEEEALSVQTASTQSDRDSTSTLELSEAIKAKTLCEKIRHFKKHVELQNRQSLVKIYLAQAVMQCVLSLASVIFNSCFHNCVNSTVKCDIEGAIYGHYDYFECSYAIAVYFHLTLIIFYVLISPYFVLCFYTCYWTLKMWKCKTPFTFKEIRKLNTKALKLGDIDPAHGDFAFMLHLLNEYNELYVYRFAVFLSQKNEKNLKDFILSKEWPLIKLGRMSTENGTKLRLNGLSGIPKAIFQLPELESLTLEDCSLSEEDFESEDWQKLELRSLSLVRCRLKSIPEAIFQNRESLDTLDLSFNKITSVPENIADLHYLHTLNIAGNEVTEGVEHIVKIDSLQVLNLRENNSLQNVPDQIASHARLRKLYVNETVSLNMSEEMKKALKGVIDTGRRSRDDVTVIEYSPSKVPHIETARKDREKVYKMTSKPKGLALIFDFLSHCHARRSSRSNVDVERLEKLFTGIGYSVKVRRDHFSAMDFKTELSDLLTNSATGDSVVVAMLAHGSNKSVFCCNGEIVSVDEIVSVVGKVDIYLDKPKLIFIPACRGDCRVSMFGLRGLPAKKGTSRMHLQTTSRNPVESDKGTLPTSFPGSLAPWGGKMRASGNEVGTLPDPFPDAERDSDSLTVSLPAYSDVLIAAYSMLPDCATYHYRRGPSWYAESLVEVFSKYAFQEDVLSLLNLVEYDMFCKFKSMRGFRQIPAPQSTLTKKLFFLPGYFENDDPSSAASSST